MYVQEYEVTSGADLELKRILRDHHYHGKVYECVFACVCVCVRERERERERDYVCVCTCM